MPQSHKRWVLDTSALLALGHNEPGASKVEEILNQAQTQRHVFISFASRMEIFYVIYQQQEGKEAAELAHAQIKRLPVTVVESNEQLGLIAGELKASYKLSFADAWIAATAIYLRAILVHKDPEFDSLHNRLALLALPYRKR